MTAFKSATAKNVLRVAVALFLLTTLLVNRGSIADDPKIEPAPPGPRCEYIPHEIYKPAADQCGFNDASAPVLGLYECGLVSNGKACVETCTFLRCHEP
jgi:hypothetical protein